MPGLDLVLERMLDTDRATRYSNAIEAEVAMDWVAQEPNAKFCSKMLEQLVVPVMRALFLKHWEEKEGIQWDDTLECGQRYWERELERNSKAGNWLIRYRLAEGDSKTWDVTALCTILLRSKVHPLEAPEDYADVNQIRLWRNKLTHECNVVWSAKDATDCTNFMWQFIQRHQQN